MSGHAPRHATEDRTSGADPLVRGRRPRRRLWMGAGSRPGGRLQTRGSAPPDCNFRGTTLGIAALMMMVPSSAMAQAVANASIHGVISDPTSAFIPLAQIKATQTDTGQVLSTLSGSDGSYVLPNLPVGPYSIEVTAPSFSGYLQSGIVLQVGNNVQVNVT